MTWLSEHWLEVVACVTSLITAASIITRWTPTTSDDAVVAKLQAVIAWLSINGKPKN